MTATNQSRPPGGGTGEQARQQASRVGQHAMQTGGQVAHAATEQGGQVAAEAAQQARNLTGQATTQLRDQARTQQHRAADGLRDLGRELGSMAEQSGESGMAGEAVRRAADAAQRAAGWLDQREPGDVLDEVRGYARQHPGTFLAGAVVAGLLVGRLTRNMTGSDGSGSGAQPAQPASPSSERAVEAPHIGDQPYTGVARAQNVSPAGRPEPEIPGGVAP
ncbi:hypothetical protein [Micromonospora sp. NPDC005305]|uniref:hypothetical protein n=1 Tax=Micromonospora sp. NPDC005305 TaxID=3156875 RepID=UPI0033AEA5CF